MRNEHSAVYIDTVTLSNFLGAEEGQLLVTQYGSRLTITSEVYTELSAGAVPARVNLEPLAALEIVSAPADPLTVSTPQSFQGCRIRLPPSIPYSSKAAPSPSKPAPNAAAINKP